MIRLPTSMFMGRDIYLDTDQPEEAEAFAAWMSQVSREQMRELESGEKAERDCQAFIDRVRRERSKA